MGGSDRGNELGLLAYVEVLPLSLDFEIEWRDPTNNTFTGTASVPTRSSTLWSACPTSKLVPGRWRVALRLAASAPSGPRLLAWRRFLVLGVSGSSSNNRNDPEREALQEFFDRSDTQPMV